MKNNLSLCTNCNCMTKTINGKCGKCGDIKSKICEHCKNTTKTKPYIIADDLENPRWLCKKCQENLMIEVLKSMSGL